MTPHFLNSIFKPQDYSQEDLHSIISKFKKVCFSKSEYLLRQGDIESNYWFIENGYARSYVIDSEGNDITTQFYEAGDIVIDWSSFFLRNPTRENIHALTDCTVWQLNFENFQQLFHSIATVREQGRERLVTSYFVLKKHHISMIADQAKERYIRLIQEKPQILQNVSLNILLLIWGLQTPH